MADALRTETVGSALVVRFTRAEVRSPLSVAVLDELVRVIGGLAESGTERVIFTGVGNVFASGADLREVAALSAEDAPEFARRGQRLMLAIADLEQETIAVVNGFCFGGALDLALACNRRIAGTNAQFAHPAAGLGIITGWGGTQRLPRLIGSANALEMFFTAAPIDAERALNIGLVDEIAADPLTTAFA